MRWQNLLRWRPNLRWPRAPFARNLFLAGAFLLASLGAFCWGRLGSGDAAHAQAPDAALRASNYLGTAQTGPAGDYSRRIVATIHGNINITREELGEYLIARFGAERLEFLVNRRIVELACKNKGVYVTDGEIQAQFEEDLKVFGVSEKDFINNILKRYNKSMYEWREDVLRPKLLLRKLLRPTIQVDQHELQQAFEARYGPKVQCRVIILAANHPQKTALWERVSRDEAAFLHEARHQGIKEFAAKEGWCPPFHKHFPDPDLERVAFSLQPGQVSGLQQLKDGTVAILRCEKHIPRDDSKRFEDEMPKLFNELKDIKLAQRMPEVFNQLRKEAMPQFYLNARTRQDQLEADVLRELGGAPRNSPVGPVVDVPPVPAPKN